MTKIEKLGYDHLAKRDLYILNLLEPDDLPKSIKLSSQHFACFIAWNSEAASVDVISNLVEHIIKAGGAYFSTWGPDCQRVHDIIDEIDAYPYNDIGSPEDSVIMTTWHEDESLEEAMCFFLTSTSPDEFYEATMNSSLAISIGSQDWAKIIYGALLNPKGFLDKYWS